jgi:hypothetical protein
MPEQAMSKEQLIQEFAAAYERLIAAALRADQRNASGQGGAWGPRAVVAHLAGWEAMANVRIPAIVGGMPPAEFADPEQGRVMNDAINSAFVALAGDQSVEALCGVLRHAYQRTVDTLDPVDEALFRPGEYVYERTRGVVEHCQEHIEVHLSIGA